jgi:hypothetical protein
LRRDLTTQFEVDENDVRPETETLLKRSQCGRQDIVDGVSERLQRVRKVSSEQIVVDDEQDSRRRQDALPG